MDKKKDIFNSIQFERLGGWSKLPTKLSIGRLRGKYVGKCKSWVVVSSIVYFYPYLGKWSKLTNIVQIIHHLCMYTFINYISVSVHTHHNPGWMKHKLILLNSTFVCTKRRWLGDGHFGPILGRRNHRDRDAASSGFCAARIVFSRRSRCFLVWMERPGG